MVQSGRTLIRPARSHSAPDAFREHPSERGCLDACRPHLRSRLDAPLGPARLHDDAGAIDFGDDALRVDLDTQMLQALCSLRGEVLPEPRQHLLASVEEQDPGRAGVDLPEVVLEHAPRQLGDLPGDLDPGRTAADDDEGEPPPPLLRVALELGHLEGPEDPPPQLEGVVDRLHSGHPPGELVVAEEGLTRTRRHDQAVVGKLEGDPVAAHCGHGPPLQVERADLGELDLDVPVAVKHPAQRWSDLALGEDPGRHLIEQRLEEVVVDAIHESDLDRRPAHIARSEQAAETSPHDHDSMGVGVHRVPVASVRPTRPGARAGGRPPGSHSPSPSTPG